MAQKCRVSQDVLADLKENKPEEWNEGKVARRDRTAAALVQLLLPASVQGAELSPESRTEMMQEAHRVEKDALGGELAVSFQGVSVAFLQKFAQEHNEVLNFLSTDAVVERVIKPASKRASVIGPTGMGRAFIETLHEDWKGPPTFFLSHAWRQTFHVAGCPWRGGAVQALIQSARCDRCKNIGMHLGSSSSTPLPSDLDRAQKEAEISAATEAGDYTKLGGVDGLVAQLERLDCSECAKKRSSTFVWFDIFCVNQVRKASVLAPVYTKNPNICQGRLGTSIGKIGKLTQRTRVLAAPQVSAWRAARVRLRSAPQRDRDSGPSRDVPRDVGRPGAEMFPPFFMPQISDGKRSFAKTGFGTSIQQEALKDDGWRFCR